MKPPETPLQAALTYTAHGWEVFPCHTITPRGCTCGQPDCHSPAKHPTTSRGLNAATTDRQQIREWWHRRPDANVAIRTGSDSGLVVIDIDPDHNGTNSLDELVERYGPLPDGPQVRTGSGGSHLYFNHPGEPIRNSAGTRFGPGIDIRGDGGYVIAPPSQHRSLATYQWHDLERAVPDLPDWVLERLAADHGRASNPRGVDVSAGIAGAWARAALTGEADTVARASEGTRNQTLNRAAFCLGQIVATGALDFTTVEAALLTSALNAGLGERESLRTLHSGITAGMDHPRTPPSARPTTAHGLDVAPEPGHVIEV